jgi:signal peptidase
MSPSMPRGSLVVVVPKPTSSLRVGDVLTYAIPIDDHRVVTHRIIEITEPGDVADGRTTLRTQGDANAAPDPWTASLDQPAAWTVVAAVPHGGTVLRALRAPIADPRFPRPIAIAIGIGSLVWIWRPDHRSPRNLAFDALAA